MIIGVTGYGSTGASAYIDLIKEFEGVQSFPDSMEFQLLHEPDGILDLERAILDGARNNMVVALSRFSKTVVDRSIRLDLVSKGAFRTLKKDYLAKIGGISWKGKSVYDPAEFKHFCDKRAFRKINRLLDHMLIKANPYWCWPSESERCISSMTHDEFVVETKDFLASLFEACGFNLEKPVLLEQVFSANTPLKGDHLLPVSSESIVVDRDPRDVYIITNFIFPYYNRFMPHKKDVKTFIEYYKAIHRPPQKFGERIHYVRYEDTIYDYDGTIEFVGRVLGGTRHIEPRKYFRPEDSINNTRLFTREEYKKCSDDIGRIEEALTEYLYPFDSKTSDIQAAEISPFEKQTDIKRINDRKS